MSDNAVAWQAGTNATWKFKTTPLNVPDDCNLELFLTATAPAIGDTEIAGGWVQINCYVNYSGSGKVRYGNGWYEGRDVLAYFRQTGHIGDSSHLTEAQQTAVQKLVNGDFLSKNDTSVTKNNNNVDSTLLSDCHLVGDFNAINFNSNHIPHNIEITKITFNMKSVNTDTPLLMYAVIDDGYGSKNVIGFSDEAKTWLEEGLVTWTFNTNPITIPNGKNLEVYFIEDESFVNGNSVGYTKLVRASYREGEGISGSYRWEDGKWYTNRLVYAIFTEVENEYLEEKFLDAKYLTKEKAAEIYATKNEVKPYDWTPDWYHAILSENSTDYTAPINGWISTTDLTNSGTVTINGNLAGYNNNSYTMLLREGDQIHFDNGANFLFAPCNAEQCDWRETKTNYDIWKNAICYDSNGTPYVQDLYIPSAASWAENIRIPNGLTITKVEDEKAYNGDTFVCNIQSTEIENGTFLFHGYNVNGVDTVADIQTWDSDLPKLKAAGYMFSRSNLSSFSGSLKSLTRGYQMFYNSKLANFNTEMPELVNGYLMFASFGYMDAFEVDTLPKLSNGEVMFAYSTMSSFSTDMPHLANGNEMFLGNYNLTDFDADLSNLKCAYGMFGWATDRFAPLSAQSISNIAEKINDIRGLNKDDDSQWKYDTTKTDGTVNLNAGTIAKDYRGVIYLGCEKGLEEDTSVITSINTIVTKGWTVYLNGELYDSMSMYNIVEGSAYIPDASGWNEVFAQSGLVVTSVHDGYGWDD